MKRCPKCDFAYEDDQSLCDMDGSVLTPATRELPPLAENVPTPTPAPPPPKSRRRRYAVLPLAGVLSLTGLYLATYLAPRRTAPQDAGPSTVSLTATPAPAPSLVVATPEATPTPAPAPTPATDAKAADSPPKKAIKRTSPAVRPTPAPAPAPPPRQEEKKPKPDSTDNKKESKLGSILKKTGRILKKPFGF